MDKLIIFIIFTIIFTIFFTNFTSGITTTTTPTECYRTEPYLAVEPESLQGTAGLTKTFSIAVGNRNNCQSTFKLTVTPPKGWKVTYKQSTSLNPGKIDSSIKLSVTPPTDAIEGTYSISVEVKDTAKEGKSVAKEIKYVVQCVRENPTIIMTSVISKSGKPGEKLEYVFDVKNNDKGCKSPGVFALTSSLPDTPEGWAAEFSVTPPEILIGAGKTWKQEIGTYITLRVTSPSTASNKIYKFFVKAANKDDESISTAKELTYKVISPCVRANPTVTVNPPSYRSRAATMATYEVKIINNDKNCPRSNFKITSRGVPTGWSYAVVKETSPIESKSTASFSITITSSSDTTPKIYPMEITVINGVETTFSTTAKFSYTVSTCKRALPTIKICPSSSSVGPGSKVNYNITIMNNDDSCPDAEFKGFSITKPDTFTYTTDIPNTFNLEPKSSKSFILSITSPDTTSSGNYKIILSMTKDSTTRVSQSAMYIIPKC